MILEYVLAIFCALHFLRKTDHFLSNAPSRRDPLCETPLLSGRAKTKQVSGLRFAIGDRRVITLVTHSFSISIISSASTSYMTAPSAESSQLDQ